MFFAKKYVLASYKFYLELPIESIYEGNITLFCDSCFPQASFQERVRSYSNWQHAQQMLTKKREALVKLELASKNEKLPQAQEEVKEVRKLQSEGVQDGTFFVCKWVIM